MAKTNRNYILEYYQQIQNGSVNVGNWIKLVYKYLVKGLEDKLFFYDNAKANRAIRFVENFCHHCKGRKDLIKLELWQKAQFAAMFGIVDEDGSRHFREVFDVEGRKNGKSLKASAIAECFLFIDGEYGADVFCIAPKLEQAEIIYSNIWQTVQAEPDLKKMMDKRKSDYYIKDTNSSVKKIAFNQKKSDGFNPSLVICDEIASWPGASGLRQYEVMKSAFGARRQPMIYSITTAGYENEGIYDELMRRSTRFLLGDSKETRLLPFLYMIDDITKWNDINELQKSNPNLGVSVSVDYLLEEIAIAEDSLSKKAEFLTKYCNVKQSSSLAWLSATDVEKACGPELKLEDFKSCYCVGGIDLSRTTDLTAAVVVIEKNGELYVFGKFYLPAEKLRDATERDGVPYNLYVQQGWLQLSGDNFIDYKDCFEWFNTLVSRQYEVLPLQIGYDRYCAQYLVQDMKGRGYHMDDVFQGWNLWPVLMEFEGLLKDGKIHIGNNPLLKMHLLNCAIKMDVEQNKGRLIKLSQTDHIDGAAALIDAFTVRQKWYSQIGEQLKNKKRT